MMSPGLLDYAQALDKVLQQCVQLSSESCTPADGVGRVLAAPVTSPANLPPFDNSAMDGFALRGGKGELAAGTPFDVGGEQAAGAPAAQGGGAAWEIMTGARLPDGFDRVIAIERVTVLEHDGRGRPARIRVEAPVPPGQFVRRAGADVHAGEQVIEAGTRLSPNQLMLLAALGIDRVEVVQRPRVAVLCTGRELVDDPTTPLASGQIRNSSGPYLAAQLRLLGAQVTHAQTVPDDQAAFESALRSALAAGVDAVISTGAVSMGRYDFVPAVLARLGAQILFHKVAVRPGKPMLFARLDEGPLLFGLPGNPVSSAASLRFFVQPALRAMTGMPAEKAMQLPLVAPVRASSDFRLHLKAQVCVSDAGTPAVRVLDGQESFRIGPLSDANAWAVTEAGVASLEAGTLVQVYDMEQALSPA